MRGSLVRCKANRIGYIGSDRFNLFNHLRVHVEHPNNDTEYDQDDNQPSTITAAAEGSVALPTPPRVIKSAMTA